MSLVLIVSIAIRIAALGWTLWLLRQIRDWRIGFMAAVIGLMTLRQSLTLRMGIESEATELPGLAVSVMIFLAVFFLGRLLTERRRAEERLKTHYRELQALQEISQNILNSLELQLIVEGILDKMLSLGSFDLGVIRLLDSGGKNLETKASRGYRGVEVARDLSTDPSAYDSSMTLIRVITEKESRVVENVPEFNGLRTFKREGVRSAVILPVLAQGRILGLIQLGSRRPRKFQSDEIHLLEAIGSQMGIAVQKARLYQDIKTQAEELERASKVKDEFLSVMSHEIRTPLNTFIGYTEMVREKALGEINRKQEEVLGKALNQAGILLEMMNRVLLTTQIDAGMDAVESEEVHLSEFLDRLKSTYGVPLAKDVTVLWNYAADLPAIKSDRNRLKHVLQNLINNAIKFTHKGRVAISARHLPSSGSVVFRVVDTGIGIARDSLPLIFEKFRQVDSSETRLCGGVGLGLYIAKQMTEKLGGTLEVESEPGKGSTFTLTIPIEA